MANICEKLLDSCISASCENPIFTGIDSTAYIFNKSEIASFTYDNTNPNIVTDITMKEVSPGVNYTGYTILQTGKTPYTGTNTALVEGNVSNTFTNTLNFIVPDNSPAAAAIIDNIANGKFVVVVKNDYTGSDDKGTFQIYGAAKGMVATAVANDKYSDDTNGGWAITLTEEKAPKSAVFFYKTSVAQTESALEGMVDCN